MTDIEERFEVYLKRYSHRNREVERKAFMEYCKEYPHVAKKFLLNEYEDKSGDLRQCRISVERGYWP